VRRSDALRWVLPPVVIGALLWFGRAHSPDYARGLFGAYGADAMELKARLGTALLGLAVLQVLLALWMYGRAPGLRPSPRVRTAHRVGGALAFLLSLPIAQHCLLAYGVQFSTARVALHSLAGCFLYGAFTAKVLVVRDRRLPGWTLPAAGGALFCAVALLWYSAALWFLNGYAVPGL